MLAHIKAKLLDTCSSVVVKQKQLIKMDAWQVFNKTPICKPAAHYTNPTSGSAAVTLIGYQTFNKA